jgi:hypothetical protein
MRLSMPYRLRPDPPRNGLHPHNEAPIPDLGVSVEPWFDSLRWLTPGSGLLNEGGAVEGGAGAPTKPPWDPP